MPCIDITDIIEGLAHLYTPDEIDKWLSSPQALLGGRTPEIMIASGHRDTVKALVSQMVDSVHL